MENIREVKTHKYLNGKNQHTSKRNFDTEKKRILKYSILEYLGSIQTHNG